MAALRSYERRFDSEWGGAAGAPKFPSSFPVQLLLQCGEEGDMQMALKTLEGMYKGGIYDHVGGGFHRYSTDDRWLVPHFEKMLYDNALLVVDYLKGYQATGLGQLLVPVRETLDYILREMTSREGAFYSATDADSRTDTGEMEEGYFFSWAYEEWKEALTNHEAQALGEFFDVTPEGNFEGRNVLHYANNEQSEMPDHIKKIWNAAKPKLYEKRSKRAWPLRDEKILTSWNGLMISAFAKAAAILDNNQYLEAARKAANFILDHMVDGVKIFRSYKDGQRKYWGYLDDYGFLIQGLLDLHAASNDSRYIEAALLYDGHLNRHFEDQEHGGFYFTSGYHEQLLLKEKPSYDGAEPSGNSVTILNLLRLYDLTAEVSFLNRAVKSIRLFYAELQRSPRAHSEMLRGLDLLLDERRQIIVIAPAGKTADLEPYKRAVRNVYLPRDQILFFEEGATLDRNRKVLPILDGKVALRGQVTAYICSEGACSAPLHNVDDFAAAIISKN
jgi:uncharacterized protein YyaL (SSP411 family)